MNYNNTVSFRYESIVPSMVKDLKLLLQIRSGSDTI